MARRSGSKPRPQRRLRGRSGRCGGGVGARASALAGSATAAAVGSAAAAAVGSAAVRSVGSDTTGYRTSMAIAIDTQKPRTGMTDPAGAHEDTDDAAGLYGPRSEAWRLNREAMLLFGSGPRSLLLQIAHPLVAEGVDQHSDFRADPWARLVATVRSYLTVV